jgi:hypothetical protein
MVKMISVRMPESDFDALKTVAEFDGMAVAGEIREAVKLLVQARREDPAFLQRIQSVMERGKALLGHADSTGKLAREVEVKELDEAVKVKKNRVRSAVAHD